VLKRGGRCRHRSTSLESRLAQPRAYLFFFFSALAARFSFSDFCGSFFFSFFASCAFMVGLGCWVCLVKAAAVVGGRHETGLKRICADGNFYDPRSLFPRIIFSPSFFRVATKMV
jgi:hypothetical protein